MALRTWRFITIILTALAVGMAFSHTLELPAKMQYPAPLYLAVQHSLYRNFGGAGAVVEIAAVVFALGLSILLRKRRPALWLTLAGAGFLLGALVAWLAIVNPVNMKIATWTVDSIPADWPRFRDQWEYGHATRFILQLLGLGVLVLSVLIETPSEMPAPEEGEEEDTSHFKQTPYLTYLNDLMKWYAESARSIVQLSIGALILPIIFSEKWFSREGVARSGPLKWPLLVAWGGFLLAAGTGAFYQYLAIKFVEREAEGEPIYRFGPLKKLIDEPGYTYGVMLWSFVPGASAFVLYVTLVATIGPDVTVGPR